MGSHVCYQLDSDRPNGSGSYAGHLIVHTRTAGRGSDSCYNSEMEYMATTTE